MNNLIAKDLEYIWHPCSQMKDYEDFPPIVIERGEGLRLYDTEGNSYLDIISSWWCNLLGHCHPRLNKALTKQVEQLEHVIFANFSHKPAIELCDNLHSILPQQLNKFFFTDNGSAAIEAALKMSLQYHYQTGKPEKIRFMALTDAYHGETVGALSVSGVDIYSKMYKPILLDTIRVKAPDCYRCEYGKERGTCNVECFAEAEKVFEEYGDVTAAFIAEPLLQGAAGMKIYPPEYLAKLRKLCDQYGVHLILDEIATGYGRTGTMFAFEQAGICPDIVCLSKGLTGGYMPMALAVTTTEIYDAFYADYSEGKAFLHSHTYSGNPMAASIALEVLKIMKDEKIIEKANQKAKILHQALNDALLDHPNVGEIRSIGLVNAIELVADKKTKESFDSKRRLGYQIYRRAVEKGLILRPLGDILYFNPPLVISESEIEEAVAICRDSILEFLPMN